MKINAAPLALWLIPSLACNFGLIDELEQLPVCGDQETDPDCPRPDSSSGETGSPIPTTSGAGEGLMTTTEDTAATLPGSTTDESTSEAPPDAAPMIVGIGLTPNKVDEAGSIAVQVEALNASEVTMTLDAGEPVSLAASGANFYTGAIEIYGSSMNGAHTVLVTATNAGRTDSKPAYFDVGTPPAGDNIWLKTNDVPNSQTIAVAVDRDSNVYEAGISGKGSAARLVVSKRDPSGNVAWPGMWMVYHEVESRGEDIAVGPDGMIYVLGNYQDKDQHTRWWLAKLDPAVGLLVGEPRLGEIDEPAQGLSIAENGDIVIVGTATVWGEQDTEDIQARIWILPLAGNGVIKDWGYSPKVSKNTFSEVPEDVAIVGERIFVTGSVEGVHLGDQEMEPRKRLFVLELDFNGNIARTYVAGNEPYLRSGGNAVADDGAGGVVAVGWACNDVCTEVADIHWLESGVDNFVLYDRQQQIGQAGPAYAMDVAHSPSGYNVVASAVKMGPGLNFALRVTGWRPTQLNPVLDYVFDTGSVEMGQAAAIGPHGYVWFGGLRAVDGTLRAVAGKCHGY